MVPYTGFDKAGHVSSTNNETIPISGGTVEFKLDLNEVGRNSTPVCVHTKHRPTHCY